MREPVKVYHGGTPIQSSQNYHVEPVGIGEYECEAGGFDHIAAYEVSHADNDGDCYYTFLCGAHLVQYMETHDAIHERWAEWADRVLYGSDN